MITKKIDLRKNKNWLKAFSLSTLLMFATSCSDTEEVVEVIDSSVTSSKLNTTFQAENYDVKSDNLIKTVGGWKVGYIKNGSWIRFDDFDHSGATSVTVSASSGKNGGTIEFRKGSANGNLLATVTVSKTSGWGDMREFSANITGSSSNSDLYLVFKSSSSDYLLDIDNFKFNSTTTNGGGGSTDNLAIGGTASQSSNYSSSLGLANLAIDGNTNGVWNNKSVTHTKTTYQPWWQVNIGSNTNIEEVVIWNRTNCCMDRLSNFDVFIYNAAGSLVFKTTYTGTPNPSVSFPTGGVSGNRVRVKLKGTNPLSLAEVQIFGEASGDGGGDGGGNGNYPGEVIGLSGQDWKLNGFVDSPSSSADYEDDVLNAAGKTFSNYEDDNYFYTDGEWAFFKCYRGLASSDSSLNPRVELRELGNGDDNYTWDGNSGTHTMEYKVRVDQLPKSTSGNDGVVCFGQIHGPGDTTDDVLRVQFRGDPNQSSGDVDLKISGYLTEKQGGSQSFSGYKLDTEYTVKIQYKNKYVTVWMNGNQVINKLMDISSKGWDWKGNYFKVGNYLQSVKGGSFDGSYGIVRIKDLSVN